jgi:hypothetical protein
MDMKPGAEASVEVFAPDGRLLQRAPVDRYDMQRNVVMVILKSLEELAPGTYRVLFWDGDPKLPSSKSMESRFELEIAEPKEVIHND